MGLEEQGVFCELITGIFTIFQIKVRHNRDIGRNQKKKEPTRERTWDVWGSQG